MDATVASSWRAFYRDVLTKYGLTPDQYRALYLAQLGRCYICRSARGKHPDDPKGRGPSRLAVDHIHAMGSGNPGAVRGLLCRTGETSCNRMVGWLRDRPEAFERGASYLREAPAQAVLARMREAHTDDDLMGMLING